MKLLIKILLIPIFIAITSADLTAEPDTTICQSLFTGCVSTAAADYVNGDTTFEMYMKFTYDYCPNAYNDCMTDVEIGD